MKLYYSPGSCSLASHIVIQELALPVELERVDLKTKITASGKDYLIINPKGYVPALLLKDGALLTEGPAILQYLADLAPEAGLVSPCGTPQRYRTQEWLTFIGTEMHKGYSILFSKEMSDDVKTLQRDKLRARLGWVEQQVTAVSFLLGRQFTVVDSYLFTVLRWSRLVGLDLSDWPAVAAYHDRVLSRPSVQLALKAEGIRR